MKITFSLLNNKSQNNQQKTSFKAGLNREIAEQIRKANISDISKRLAQDYGIPNNFKENRYLAWLNLQTAKIYQQLNTSFRAGLALPKGIYVEDFVNLKLKETEQSVTGFCNASPTRLRKNSEEIVPSRVIFFNSFDTLRNKTPKEWQWICDWNHANRRANYHFETRRTSTNSFLNDTLHEFVHVAFLDRLLERLGRNKLAKELDRYKSDEQLEAYRRKYRQKLFQICDYALEGPFETIACDIPRIIADSLDPKTLLPTRNPFVGTPYERLSYFQRRKTPNYLDEERPLNEILRHFWNGDFY